MSLRSLTSLRFFAALMVMLSHLEFLESSSIGAVSWLAKHIFYEGYVGVTFFFVLSGFILSHSYSTRMNAGSRATRKFIYARIARIFPIHLLTLLFAILLAIVSVKEFTPSFFAILLANTFLAQAWIPAHNWYFSFNAPSWSLSVEIFFYLAFPFLVTLKSRTLFWFVAVLIGLKAALTIAASDAKFLLYIFPPLRIGDFICGILLHRVFGAIGPVSRRTATMSQLISMVILATAALFSPLVSQGSRFDLYYLAPMSFLILSFAWQNGYAARLVSGSLLVLLGEASFSLYMIHQMVIRYGKRLLEIVHVHPSGLTELSVAAAYVVGSILISIVLFKMYEMPAKESVMRFLSSRFPGRPLKVDPMLDVAAPASAPRP